MIKKSLLFLILLGLNLFPSAYATGGKDGRNSFVLLIWTPMSGTYGYNIYRKDNLSASYPSTPINSAPVRRVSNCDKLKAIIPVGSEEWNAISKALAYKPEKSRGKPGTGFPPGGGFRLRKMLPGGYVSFDPCSLTVIPDTGEVFEKVKFLAKAYYKIALAMGFGYMDENLTYGKTYWYKIVAVDRRGHEGLVVATDVRVVAGKATKLPAPPNLRAIPGDNQVQLLWDEMDNATGFEIQRKKTTGTARRINEATAMGKCNVTINGDTIPESYCFLDYVRWDENGNPVKHVVQGDSIDGPFNGTKYYYRVRAYDILGRPGTWSSWKTAKPVDKTPPAVPYGVEVVQQTDALLVRWYRVNKDIKGNKEINGVKGYRVYRFTKADSLGDSTIVATLVPQPPDTGPSLVTFRDTDPSLRSPEGEKTYWYRVRTIDMALNKSALSAAAGGYLPDTTPPPPPVNLRGEGYEKYIKLAWEKPAHPPKDLAGYMIYRGICGGDSVCVESVRNEQKQWECRKKEYRIYPLSLIATISDTGTFTYEDHTVPEDSPICYRYSVKAFDRSQNISDTSKTVCVKLREKTPPPPPVISALKARNRAIKVEWVAPPVQDLFGFIVERAERPSGPWVRVSDSLIFPERCNCEDIPATNIWAEDSIFSFLDTTVQPKITYYYRVRAADYLGNIGDPSVPVETYTFDFALPPKPFNVKVNPAEGCILEITWEPGFTDDYLGFVVFRSENPTRGFIQISPLLKVNKYMDRTVVKGKEYWYRVQCIGKNGNHSRPSASVKGVISP